MRVELNPGYHDHQETTESASKGVVSRRPLRTGKGVTHTGNHMNLGKGREDSNAFDLIDP